jgi:hypothetical protein
MAHVRTETGLVLQRMLQIAFQSLRTDETRPQEKKTENLCSEEKLDHLVGETTRPGDLRLGDDGYPELVLADAVLNGHITQAEAESRYELHKLMALA